MKLTELIKLIKSSELNYYLNSFNPFNSLNPKRNY